MKQIISKDKKVICTAIDAPYPKGIIKSMKEAGYKVKTIDDEEKDK